MNKSDQAVKRILAPTKTDKPNIISEIHINTAKG